MNIILEGGINFYDELHNVDTDTEADNCCLLTSLPLDKNSIKLPCNHEFNFLPLYNEVYRQKTTTSSSHLNTDKLLFEQIKCPYCRQKFDFLLPHVRLNTDMIFCPGVNSPEKYCMNFHTCEYMFKTGKNKGEYCSKTAYYDNAGCYCSAHHSTLEKRNSIHKSNIGNIDFETTTSSHVSHIHSVLPVKTSIVCSSVFTSGKRIGQICGSKTCAENNQYCKRHLPK